MTAKHANKTKQAQDVSFAQIGAVLVVGGGIGGMQASLDLANAGFKVYLVEETTAIGGRMSQLDKTFPTNDCSMCIISPKLVEVGRHLNIDVITNAEVSGIEGEAGNFKVDILKKPRFVDLEKCTGCAECVINCPVEVLSEFDENLKPRKAIYKRYPQAIPNAYAIEKLGTSPCKIACPAHINVQGYVALIAQGKFTEALALIRKDNPLPAVCGRVCTHPCETECTRRDVDEPIAICYLKRFVADDEKIPEIPDIQEKRSEKVAIVGSGPAGLSCANYLALAGYPVTIFESLPVAGGMLSVGIPQYRLPKNVLNKEIEYIKALGVEIKTNTKIGPELTLDDLKNDGYKATFLSVGAHLSRKLGIEGEDLEGVVHGVDYLREVSLGKEFYLGERVVVIGGGNVAIDSVRTALREGSKEAFIVYRRSREEMPASETEIKEAEEEGVNINYLAAPVRIIGKDGKVSGLECVRMKLGEPDESGRRRPIPIEGSEFTLSVDAVIPAIGQSPDLSFLATSDSLEITKGDTIVVDSLTLATNIPGVFAGGDVVSGPATVIEAIAAGKEVAISIDRYLRGEDINRDRSRTFTKVNVHTDEVEKVPRRKMPTLSPQERIVNYKEVQTGFSEEEAINEAKRCLACGICSECLQCVEACLADAIDHDMKEEQVSLNVGSIILTPGFEKFDPELKGEYGYKRVANVVTSLELERIFSASGPFEGEILRPSDKKEPHRIAWIQCVGSRDSTCNREYCSSVCCTYATKEAIMAKDHLPDLEATVFYNDMRTFGKGFERYFESAKKNYGVRYVKSIVSTVKEMQQTKNVLIQYATDEGEIKEEEFDLVVLSLGLVPSASTKLLTEKLSVDTDQFGFCKTESFAPNVTSRPGIYVAGAFEAPKDIPETVMTASSASALSAELLSSERGKLIVERKYPQERDVREEEPRVGVFVCHCGINIARVVDVPQVVEYAKSLANVVHVEDKLYTCSTDATRQISETIKEMGLNRVVVASCSPRTHEPIFQDTLREAGLNRYLFDMANIRDQCSWVHAGHPELATEKAKDLVRMAVSRVCNLESLDEIPFEVTQKGLVVGGGLSGITAALSLASQGFEAFLIEKTDRLGGNLADLYYTLEGHDPQLFLQNLLQQVEDNPKIKVYKNTEVLDFSGHVGNYRTKISVAGKEEELDHGITIVATGGMEYKPEEYLYKESDQVITQKELEQKIALHSEQMNNLKDVVMIQCVGSREDDHQYCSRICCSSAIKNALKLKEINPDTNVYILYRDMRTYGFKELYYKEARRKGIKFIRYEKDKKPLVTSNDNGLMVEVFDLLLGSNVEFHPDYLVLSSAIRPHTDSANLATTLKLPLDPDRFFLEAHMKLRPLDFTNEGVYLCGLAHSPKLIEESISQARGAAARACTVLSHQKMFVSGIVAMVDGDYCAACLTCVRACPYGVPFINAEGVAEIEVASCHGCGACVSACPRKAIHLQHYKDDQILSKLEVLF
ncbi:MAG: NAD(P)-binding protein [Thermodesulfobacteriota bacterium]|nr:NAD(P)-binding protein [Thermodesulfobacteriota bacterium]